MNDFKINYNKLENMNQINYFIIVIFIIIIFIFLLIISCLISAYHIETFYGIYDNNILKIKINNELSDIIKNNNSIIFSNKNVSYEVIGFNNYEVIDDKIILEIDLKIDGDFYQNEVGKVTLKYDKEKIIKHIFKLFK